MTGEDGGRPVELDWITSQIIRAFTGRERSYRDSFGCGQRSKRSRERMRFWWGAGC